MYVNVSVDESFSSESQNLRGIKPFEWALGIKFEISLLNYLEDLQIAGLGSILDTVSKDTEDTAPLVSVS